MLVLPGTADAVYRLFPAAVSGDTAPVVQTTGAQPERTGYPLVDWALETFVDGASITLGAGLRRSSFTMTRKSDRAVGTIVDRDYPAVFFVYGTKPTLINDSHFGYTFMFRLSTFDMNRQITAATPAGGSPSGAHSSIRGIIGYTVPSLYYQWGDQALTGTYFLVGAGVGLVTSTYEGTMQLRTTTGLETVDVRDDSFSLKPAWGAFVEARWRHAGIYLSLMRAQMPGGTYDTAFEDTSCYLGYRIFF